MRIIFKNLKSPFHRGSLCLPLGKYACHGVHDLGRISKVKISVVSPTRLTIGAYKRLLLIKFSREIEGLSFNKTTMPQWIF